MSLSNNTNIFSATESGKPPPVAVTADNILQACRDTTDLMLKTQRDGIDALWYNPNSTPQEVCDALGTSAAKVFHAHGGLTQLLLQLSQLEAVEISIKLPTHEFVINPDGTVTVGAILPEADTRTEEPPPLEGQPIDPDPPHPEHPIVLPGPPTGPPLSPDPNEPHAAQLPVMPEEDK